MKKEDQIVRFQMRITAELSERINEWRIKHAPLEPRSVAIRQLLEAGLKSFDGTWDTKE